MLRIEGSNATGSTAPLASTIRRGTAMALMLAVSLAGACKREADQTPTAQTPTAEPSAPTASSTPTPSETTTRQPAATATTVPAGAGTEPAALTQFTVPEVNTEGLSALIRTEIAGARANARTSPTAPSAIARLGALCYVHADPQVAVTCFARAAALEPANDRWILCTALAQTKAQDQKAALATYEALLARKPDAGLAKVRMAELLSSTDPARAQALYEEALQAGLDAPFIHFDIAQTLRATGRRAEAIEHLRRAVEQAPRFAEAHGVLAALLRETGNAEEASRHERQQAVNSQLLPPMDPFELEILITGRDPRAAAQEAFASARNGDARRAQTLAGRALQVDQTARLARHALALVHLIEGRPNEAVAGLRELLREDPSDVWVKSDLGEALTQLQQYDEAERLFAEVQTVLPDDSLTLRRLARLEAARGNPELAASHLREAAANSVDARFDLARLLRAQGDRTGALEQIRAGLELAPNSVIARHMLAVLLHEGGDDVGAVAELERCLADDPKFSDSYQLLAVIRFEKQDYIGGELILRKGIQEAPDSIVLQNALAWILATSPASGQRKADEALMLALAVCDKTQHREFSLLDTLAAAYAEMGQFDEAVKTQREAIRLAEEAGHPAENVSGYRERLQLYEIRMPYHQKP